MTKFYASFRASVVRGAAITAVFAIASAARAALYWDQNGTLGGAGTWDNGITTNWRTTDTNGAADSIWTPNNGTQDAAFKGTASYIVTIASGTTINANSLTLGVTTGNVRITGGTVINITDPVNSIKMNTNIGGSSRAQIIETPISGTNISVVPDPTGTVGVNALLTLGPNSADASTAPHNTFTGDLIFAGTQPTAGGLSQITINNPNALPTTATVRMKHDLSQLLFGAGAASGTTAFTATFNNNIILNDSGSGTFGRVGVGVAEPLSVITLGGVISGNANFVLELGNGTGQGTLVLANTETYTGSTQINTQNTNKGTLRLGLTNAVPVGSSLTVTRGNFDMAGFNQQVGGLNGNANGWVSNTGGSLSTLTISGSGNGTFAGTIGANTSVALPGSNDNEALVLASTNTGTVTLSGVGNSYNGGTTINGGKLFAANGGSTTFSATGVGPVTVNSGGTLGGNGSVGDNLLFAGAGNVTVNSGGHLQPGLRTGTTIGTLTVFNALTLNSGSALDMELGSPAPGEGTSDRIAMSGTAGNFALTVPAAANSIGVNLSDATGSAAGNSTYVLMTFQAGTYTGSSNASQFSTSALPTPNSLNGGTIAYHLADSTNTVQDGNPSAATRVIMTVTGGPNALLWKGGASGTWDTSALNFDNVGTGATGVAFAGNDNVTFDDTGANTNPITVAGGGVQPNIVTINNTNTPYAFSGGDIKGSSVGGGGGLFLAGTGTVTIDNKYTAVGPITSNKTGTGAATFNGAITAATSLTVNGGAVTLSGANTYSGNNTINGGSLTVSGASATFGSGNVMVNAGSAAISAGVTNAILDSALLTLLGGGTANVADAGFISLAAGINERVVSLFLGTTNYTTGTFGATGSGATNIFDEYFSGSGIITVGAAGLPGDFNSDGKVDAGDYATWRKNDGPNAPLANDNGVGTQAARFSLWRANFGKPPGAGSSLGDGIAVPEPTTLMLSLVMVGSLLVVGRRKR